MTKEIYEKKHLFVAVIDAVLFTVIPVFALGLLILLPTARNTAFEAEWLHVALVGTLAVLCVFLLVMGPFTLWERYKRYMDLCVGGQPAVKTIGIPLLTGRGFLVSFFQTMITFAAEITN